MPSTDTVPVNLSEVVLRTGQYEAMRDWYCTVLSVKPMLESRLLPRPDGPQRICFLRLHSAFPFTQTLAIFEVEGLGAPDARVPGLHHFQVQLGFISSLFDRYEALRERGIRPARSMNHGPSTSFYYDDPDANAIEVSAQNYATEAEAIAYIRSDAFRRNPSGIEVDPDEFVARFRAGTPWEEQRRIPDIDPTTSP